MTAEQLTHRPPLRQHRLHIGDIRRAMWLVELVIAIPTIITIGRTYGQIRTIRYVIGLTAALVAQHTFLSIMRHKIGSEKSSLADLLTLSRATTGAVLAGLVTSGIRDRKGVAGWIAWSMTLLGVTASDWLDGPLARHAGLTRLGAVLDIEADSWLTFWSAAGAIVWGDLPGWCLLPPIVRYIDPLIDILDGKLPKGGGPWWSRVTGTAQMVLIIAALAPIRGRLRDQALAIAALPISTAQLVTTVVLLMKKPRAGRENIHGHL
jgi:phosphatidylglycerophosphate synthase